MILDIHKFHSNPEQLHKLTDFEDVLRLVKLGKFEEIQSKYVPLTKDLSTALTRYLVKCPIEIALRTRDEAGYWEYKPAMLTIMMKDRATLYNHIHLCKLLDTHTIHKIYASAVHALDNNIVEILQSTQNLETIRLDSDITDIVRMTKMPLIQTYKFIKDMYHDHNSYEYSKKHINSIHDKSEFDNAVRRHGAVLQNLIELLMELQKAAS
jgi:hypothetical protein